MANMGSVTVDLAGVMPRCRDCKWWGIQPLSLSPWPATWKPCYWIDEPDGAVPLGMLAGIEPATTGRGASLMTAPEFGCVLFTSKIEGG